MRTRAQPEWAQAVISVGEGRGFIVGTDDRRFVVTAGHCLPELPPSDPGAQHERTYACLLGPIGSERTVWAECLYVDPVADLAVLGSPETEVFYEQAGAYDTLVAAFTPLPIGDLITAPVDEVFAEGRAWLLSLDGRFFECRITVCHDRATGTLMMHDAAQDLVGGMSGSPILNGEGTAVGVLCCSGGETDDGHRESGPNPVLLRQLPSWLLDEIRGAYDG